MDLFRTAKPNLRSVKNYQPGKPIEELEREYGVKNAVKMASNENALGPSPKAVAAMARALPSVHRYPDGGCHALRQKLSKLLKVSTESLIFGNGSDEILVMAVRTFAGPGDEIVIADPTFLIYEIAGQVENARIVKVPMKDFRYDLGAMAGKINDKTKLVFIANPDNPVGTYVPEKALVSFLKTVPDHVVVVLDEAYCEFALEHKDYPRSLKLIDEFPNLIIARTFSKAYGLSGLRIGYAVARPDIIYALGKVKEPFNVNLLAQAAAVAALDDRTHLSRTLSMVAAGRASITAACKSMGLRMVETATNFVLIDLGRDASPAYEALLRKGVIVRPMGVWGLKTFIRVTIGKPAENKRFIQALKESLK